MAKFREGEGGVWLVTQTLSSSREVINSCKTREEAEYRAFDLASQSPDQQVTLYQAIERFTVGRTPVQRQDVDHTKEGQGDG